MQRRAADATHYRRTEQSPAPRAFRRRAGYAVRLARRGMCTRWHDSAGVAAAVRACPDARLLILEDASRV